MTPDSLLGLARSTHRGLKGARRSSGNRWVATLMRPTARRSIAMARRLHRDPMGRRSASRQRPRISCDQWRALSRRPATLRRGEPVADAKLWAQKWRWYQRNDLPWNRAQIHCEFARRALLPLARARQRARDADEGRLERGRARLLEPGVWLTAPARPDHDRRGRFLNLGVQVAAIELVEIGDHCMFANGCFVTDGNHRFDDPDSPSRGRASRRRARRGSATTSGAARTSSSRAA
jgi:hypothetical protein